MTKNINYHLKNKLFSLFFIIGTNIINPSYALATLENNLSKSQATLHSSNLEYNKELVVLVHGLMRSSLSMATLKPFLEKQGYQVSYYTYPSPKYTIHQHALLFNKYIQQLLIQNPDKKINFVTHSLGGIVVRESLSTLPTSQLKNIGSIVMLAPPNQGSYLAKLSTHMFPMITKWIKPLEELSSEKSAYVHHIPVPHVKIGIIAGRFDAKVPPSSAYLNGYPDPVIINTTHTFIMNHPQTKNLIATFLAKGSFEPDKPG